LIEINCSESRKTVRLTTKAPNTRILFKNCATPETVVNTTNNNQADFFPLKNQQWTSDFIPLSEGQNQLQARWGESIQTIEIKREILKKGGLNEAL
jgi:hypothetical protein